MDTVHKTITSPAGLRLVADVREICARLPETVEKIDGFGHTTFRVGDKPFVFLGEGEQGISISIKADKETQAFLLAKGPYTKTPYIGQHGWVSLHGPDAVPGDELRDLIVEGYGRTASKRLLKKLREAKGRED
ncbi:MULTISPECIES: MmcQ/YjbR family DNA-binding protein [Paenibacillus]|uniref:MmcQ/YjbR family DNA-binding protein n=1 Tax=Paenibacillus TaxID=44249 RepID=UPI0022B8DFDF|nr:MmcQ/YjbR family DNA-binding protein [Paenibacillus caseinilyticus]MCZ8521130.1 MmcQ/YjbR family DNA-binding protein [Paenibacillus caseinilyticus]